MKIGRINLSLHCLFLAAFLVALSIIKFKQHSVLKNHNHLDIRLSFGPPEQEVPDIWDPPYVASIKPNGCLSLQGQDYKLPDLPNDLTEWLLVQPFDLRGFSLNVSPDATLQDVVTFLDATKPISDQVKILSQIKLGIPGGRANSYLWYHSNTKKPCFPLPAPPPPPSA